MNIEDRYIFAQNEILRLTGLLRVASRERWEAETIGSSIREQNIKLWVQNEALQNDINFLNKELKEKAGLKSRNSAIRVMCEAYAEMNAIRARDGVPRCFDGRKSDVSQEWWDSIMERLNTEVVKATGKPAWLNPILFKEA